MSHMQLSQSQQPEILRELRQKSLTLQLSINKQAEIKKQSLKILDQFRKEHMKLEEEKQIQYRKNKSMIVLLNELEQMYYQNYLENKLGMQDEDENMKSMQNIFLRHLLIRQTENNKEIAKVLNLLKQLQLDKNKAKAKEFIKKSNFLQNQAEIIAKLRNQLASFKNQNLQCVHKWYDLQQEMHKLEHDQKLYSIQLHRQKTELKEQYENYLDRMNEAKMKLVSFNETQRESIITDYFVKQIAVLQQKRVQIEEQNKNLMHHYENLQEELNRINIENKELKSFFTNQGQECALARKMKTRIEQLRDVLIEFRKKNKDTRSVKLSKTIENIRNQLRNVCEANDLMEMRIRDQQDYGASLDEKPIGQFFEKILSEKDQQILILKERENGLIDEHKQLEIKKNLLESQINNLEENVKFDNYEARYHENEQWRNTKWSKENKNARESSEGSIMNWKKVTKETDKALGMDTYLEGTYK